MALRLPRAVRQPAGSEQRIRKAAPPRPDIELAAPDQEPAVHFRSVKRLFPDGQLPFGLIETVDR